MSNPYQNQYTTNGIETTFAYTFLILDSNTDIICYYIPAGQVFDPDSDVVSNYTVTINVPPSPIGGNVIFTVPPVAGGTLLIVRDIADNLQTNFAGTYPWNGLQLDKNFLKVQLLFQQSANQNDTYNIHLPKNYPDPENLISEVQPLLDGQIWKRVNDVILNVTLEDPPDVSTLRSELASEINGADGARLVGYFNSGLSPTGQTIKETLDYIISQLSAITALQPYVLDQKVMNTNTVDYTLHFGTFLLCDGRAVSRTTYADYFAKVGTSYGAGDGTTTFNIPLQNDKALIGSSATHPLYSSGGNIEITQQSDQVGSHTHTVSWTDGLPMKNQVDGNTAQVGSGSDSPIVQSTDITISTSAAPVPMNIMNPYLSQNMFVFVGVPAA